ncbi:hypothetical protein BX285_3754 [Streptomyces sp. 1114.5]|uniref:hypothetical protein n=1 Tax=unclassified Streptomyces TaxID=2593676 RepID=UPI000BCEA6E6|nr:MULTISPECIES: hypothetical protein [unclassified Streptomyces]RKT19298.1 hypothetical protein BX285_3754 [Streptomyces sp. 1114.5]SOB85495.1 hypothetical protein SAMN06272789_5783 [Streptomyces sp. 1331.2]
MRRTVLAALFLGALLVPAGTATAAAADSTATGSTPREVNQGYSIPVGGVTDLGALPVLGSLGLDFARLLGQ